MRFYDLKLVVLGLLSIGLGLDRWLGGQGRHDTGSWYGINHAAGMWWWVGAHLAVGIALLIGARGKAPTAMGALIAAVFLDIAEGLSFFDGFLQSSDGSTYGAQLELGLAAVTALPLWLMWVSRRPRSRRGR